MRIEFTKAVTYGGQKFEAGQKANLTKTEARHLIGLGLAQAIEPARPAGAAAAKTNKKAGR